MPEHSASVAIDAAAASLADKVTTGGAVTGVVGWAMQINWIGLTGLLVALGGVLISWYFQAKRDRREEEIHQLTIKAKSARAGRHE